MKEIFILTGSNRGIREEYLLKALEMIDSGNVRIVRKSSVYESSPWGFDDPVPFLNQVAELESDLLPDQLMQFLQKIEEKMGRVRTRDGYGSSYPGDGSALVEDSIDRKRRYSARTIDIDILFYGSILLFSEQLTIPHPRLHERRFTLEPMLELAPHFLHPVFKQTIAQLVEQCADTGLVKVVGR